MRVVGLLLISALMIIPNATAQLLGRSFRSSMWWAVAIGVVSSVGGVLLSYQAETPSGGTIVLLAIALFLLVSAGSVVADRARRAAHARSERHDHEHGPGCGHPPSSTTTTSTTCTTVTGTRRTKGTTTSTVTTRRRRQR